MKGMDNAVLVQVNRGPAIPVEAEAITFSYDAETMRLAGPRLRGLLFRADGGVLSFPVDHCAMESAMCTPLPVTAQVLAVDSGQIVAVTGEAVLEIIAGEPVMRGTVRGEASVLRLWESAQREDADLLARVSPST